MNTQSHLYQELTHNELLQIMASVFPEENVVNHYPLSGGLFNTTYRVITDRNDVILRMGPVHRELLLPYEHELMAAEVLTNKLCLENRIPAPVILHLDTSKTIVDRDFMVVERIDSIPLSDPSIPPEQSKSLLCECGKLARKIHAITGEKFGRLSHIVAGKGHNSWYAAIIGELNDLFTKADAYCIFEASLPAQALAFVASRKALLDTVTVPHLAHSDLWAGNILVREKNREYQVCAIIDGDRALFGDADFDLASPWMITPEFLSGYGQIELFLSPEDTAKKRQVYTLLLALQDAYVWKVEYNRDDLGNEHIASALKILDS